MKVITAFVRINMLDHVLHALERCEHFPGVTVSACHGESRGRGSGGSHLAPPGLMMYGMRRLELFCSDEHHEHLANVIREAAHTGIPGDGVIGIGELTEVVRIRGGERNDAAV